MQKSSIDTSQQNLTAYETDHLPVPGIYPWHAGMICHRKKPNACDASYEKMKNKNHMIISVDAEKALDNI